MANDHVLFAGFHVYAISRLSAITTAIQRLLSVDGGGIVFGFEKRIARYLVLLYDLHLVNDMIVFLSKTDNGNMSSCRVEISELVK